MTSTPVNGADTDLATFDESLPAIQALAEITILKQLIGIFPTDVTKTTLPSYGRRLKQDDRQQQQPRGNTTDFHVDYEAPR